MKRKWLALSTIAAIAIVGMFVLENTAPAHEQAQRKNPHRNAGRSRTPRMMNPVSALNDSWVDLAFKVKVDQETLAKALPIYQETREAIQAGIKEARKTAETKLDAVKKARETVGKAKTKFNASLKEILTEEQMTKLTALAKRRHMAAQKRIAATQKRLERFRRSQQRQNHSDHDHHHHGHH